MNLHVTPRSVPHIEPQTAITLFIAHLLDIVDKEMRSNDSGKSFQTVRLLCGIVGAVFSKPIDAAVQKGGTRESRSDCQTTSF